jgi:DNA-binding response OmpR family regulator
VALARLTPVRILLVDDDPLLLKSLRDVLHAEGHAVTAADGGQRGIEEFMAARERGESFAVVITDLGMPNVNGRAVAAAIKAVSREVAVILLTGWGQRLNDESELPENVDCLLGKPPRLAELRAALAAVVAGGGA